MDVHERLIQFIAYKGLNNKQFETIAGLSNGSVAKISDNIRKSTIDRISKAFPDLNTKWMMEGEGDMTLNKNVPVIQSTTGRGNSSDNGGKVDNALVKALMDRIKYQEHLIDNLLNKIILLLQYNAPYGCER